MRNEGKVNAPLASINGINLLTPTKVRRAVCQKAEPIPPLQYYGRKGESIYVLDYSSHRISAKLFLHLDPSSALLAQLFVGEDPKLREIPSQGINLAELRQLSAFESDFGESLLEMHLIASQTPLQLYDQTELEQLREETRKAPIIIGGCGRSGTTLLLSILGSHPAILAFPEELYAFYPKPFRLGRLLKAIRDYGKGRVWQRWCEKTPKNVRTFHDIQQMFGGQVKIFHVVRDGRDVVTSHHPNDASRYYVPPERWVADVEWGLRFDNQVLQVRYEDLVNEPRRTAKKLCEYIGENFDVRMLSHEKFSTVRENKAWEGQRSAPLNTESIGRWRLPVHFQRVEEFMNFAGAAELLQQLHYV